jgi:hypothetical protein
VDEDDFWEDVETAESPSSDFSWMPPLQDFVIETTVYLWLRLEYRGGLELQLAPCGTHWAEGQTPPDWYVQDGGDYLLTPFECGHHAGDRAQWGLERGLAPGQPFLVEIKEPTWHRTSYEYDEWDQEIEGRIVRALPRTAGAAAKAWTNVHRRVALAYAQEARRIQHLDRLTLLIRHWRVVVSCFSGQCSVELSSKLTGRRLATGYVKSPFYHANNEEVTTAAVAMLDNLQKKHPSVAVQRLFEAAGWAEFVGRYPIRLSVWDRLRFGSCPLEEH